MPSEHDPTSRALRFSSPDNAVKGHHAVGIPSTLSEHGRSVVRSSNAQHVRTVCASDGSNESLGSVSGGGRRASGSGCAHGDHGGPDRSERSSKGPRFDQAVEPGGYLWWYVDVVSDDGRDALTLILFVGSVFSPFYARARARQGAAVDPDDFCAVNIALYGERTQRWAFSEHPRAQVHREPQQLTIGRTRAVWEGDKLVVSVDERAAPLWNPRKVIGRIEVVPTTSPHVSFAIDHEGRHRWWPIAPSARAFVHLERPDVRLEGSAYLDSNFGTEPLADGFSSWHWSRSAAVDGGTTVLYDAAPRRGPQYERAMSFGSDGSWTWVDDPLLPVELPRASWGVQRWTRADAGHEAPRLIRTLEDSPFYTREILEGTVRGQRGHAVHESIDLDRWRRPIVQGMLPFRMRRWSV